MMYERWGERTEAAGRPKVAKAAKAMMNHSTPAPAGASVPLKGPKAPKTAAELTAIALKAVATRRANAAAKLAEVRKESAWKHTVPADFEPVMGFLADDDARDASKGAGRAKVRPRTYSDVVFGMEV